MIPARAAIRPTMAAAAAGRPRRTPDTRTATAATCPTRAATDVEAGATPGPGSPMPTRAALETRRTTDAGATTNRRRLYERGRDGPEPPSFPSLFRAARRRFTMSVNRLRTAAPASSEARSHGPQTFLSG